MCPSAIRVSCPQAQRARGHQNLRRRCANFIKICEGDEFPLVLHIPTDKET